MAQRFHSQLKTSLRAVADLGNWTGHLHLIHSDIHSARPSDLDCSAPKLMFGAAVRLLAEMLFPTFQGSIGDLTNLFHYPCQLMCTLLPVPPRLTVPGTSLEKDLESRMHHFLRFDRSYRSVGSSYNGSFHIAQTWSESKAAHEECS
ncbi:hypothetical protein SprV_0301039500 [Sparganum proliferum]